MPRARGFSGNTNRELKFKNQEFNRPYQFWTETKVIQ
jgi:hypothetical protein